MLYDLQQEFLALISTFSNVSIPLFALII